MMEGIIYRYRAGNPWRDLPEVSDISKGFTTVGAGIPHSVVASLKTSILVITSQHRQRMNIFVRSAVRV
ncbi:hypothetical protein E3N85_03920 [Cryobacterium sp. Hz9]|nr:hypothetical protein E3N85_03920 [Cryobacterium sp. Hz9]